MKLWTVNNQKILKSRKQNYYSIILHLAPGNLSGTEMCAARSPGCTLACLNLAGCGPTTRVQKARLARTTEFIKDPIQFESDLAKEIFMIYTQRAIKSNMNLCVRVNGTSDRPDLARSLALRFRGIQFYDYTKLPRCWERELDNYQITFSRSENNEAACFEALDHGINVAVVFAKRRKESLPITFWDRPVVDGDVSDLRFLDPRANQGYVIGLRAKGKHAHRSDTNGFVVGGSRSNLAASA